MRLTLAILLVLSLAACNNVKNVEITCATASGALKGLTIANNVHALPAKVQQDVIKAGDIVATTCASPTQPTATAQFQAAASVIVADYVAYKTGGK